VLPARARRRRLRAARRARRCIAGGLALATLVKRRELDRNRGATLATAERELDREAAADLVAAG
jgi:hypothetical protein